MTKKDKDALIWRLKELPTGGEIADLVAQDVISKDEAREILFEKSNQDEVIKALKDQIQMQQGYIEQLIKNRGVTWTYTASTPLKYWINTPAVYTMTTASTNGTKSTLYLDANNN